MNTYMCSAVRIKIVEQIRNCRVNMKCAKRDTLSHYMRFLSL